MQIETIDWIPCRDFLPNDPQYVLVTANKGGVTTALYDAKNKQWFSSLARVPMKQEPIAWARFPEGYKNEQTR